MIVRKCVHEMGGGDSIKVDDIKIETTTALLYRDLYESRGTGLE